MYRNQQIEYLNNVADAEIDYSDASELPDKIWKNAKRAEFFKSVKIQKTIFIDADVLEWLESEGLDYQIRLNDILRQEMERESHS